ncbi:SAM-dependent methyltransferase [Allocatelliglobosispora scoriae]|uniref:SAM-dependent methyltransferase n=1 Tax=Allocatelliglobosispora scoriae TaxID=643052 RepID=A0A841C588_9ACTN|nr:methyltransferase domain-containing protein [Allocatelliglobosispora scoriae]MBB5874459.1 SAM-dependent methyltransferase [Allocatelliglobosispora scoriae]
MTDTYSVTAEFYDLLQATQFLRTAERLLDRWLGTPHVGILDIGAGTGLATCLMVGRSDVTVHAVEPAAGMRSVMLSRLAGRSELLSRVRVHARGLQDLGLSGVADFAWCLNTMGSLSRAERAAGLAALATAVVPGGTLVVQRPPAEPGAERADLPSWQLGGDLYSGEVACVPTGPELVEWRFTYRVARDGILIREESETFAGHLATEAEFAEQLAAAGFAPVGTDEPDVVIARRIRVRPATPAG